MILEGHLLLNNITVALSLFLVSKRRGQSFETVNTGHGK